jgi:hypothetical protein
MRNGIINGTSPKEDIWGVLTGVWNHYRTGLNKQWLVTKTPFFVHLEATLQEGTHQLPIAPNSTKALYWTSRDQSGSIVIKAGQTGFTLPVASFVEMTIFGNTDTEE